MNEKIVDFLEISNIGEPFPIEKDFILKKLQEIPDDFHSEYIQSVGDYLDDLALFKNIVISREKSNLCQHLIDNLNETQLQKLNRIVLSLSIKDPIANIEEINAATFNQMTPSHEITFKAKNIVSKIRSLPVNFKAKAEELAVFSRQVKLLSNIFCVLNLGREHDDFITEQLSIILEEDLDAVLMMIDSYVANKE